MEPNAVAPGHGGPAVAARTTAVERWCRHGALTCAAYAAPMDLWDALQALWQLLVLVARFLGWLLGVGH